MIIRREGFGRESRRDSLARRLDAVAEIRRREYASLPLAHRRYEEARFTASDQNPPGQDAA